MTDDTFFTVDDSKPIVDDPTIVNVKNVRESGIFLRATSTVPTGVPRNALDKFQLYINAGTSTYRLYIYDARNKTWRYATLT